ncbi:MAG: hypothetical protein MUD01_04790, partial [Chloroflexaceae bacterium]|nr:hypothetical protein [Chloroflexaceae bacterium]
LPLLWRVLLLTWALALLAGLCWLLDALLLRKHPRWRPWRVALPVALAAAGLLACAWHAPQTLAWALPNIPWMLGVATLLLAALAQTEDGRPETADQLPQFPRKQEGLQFAGQSKIQNPKSKILLPLVLLLAAQTLFHMQTQVVLGVALALAGLLLLRPGVPAGDGGLAIDDLRLTIGNQRLATDDWKLRTANWQLPAALGAIFLLALGMRLYQIDWLPFGLWRDEARHGLVALDIIGGYRPIYIAENRVNMPALGLYPFALAIEWFGIHIWTMRLVTGVAGALTVFPLYAFTGRLTGRRDLALLAAALLAVSSWHISISRFSFPTVFEPLLGLTGLWLLLLGNQQLAADSWQLAVARRGVLRAVLQTASCLLLSGVFLGLAMQNYHTGRVLPLVALVLALLLLWRQRERWRQWLVGMLAVALGGLLVLAPLLNYAIERPSAFNNRVNEVFLLSETALYGRGPLAALDESVALHGLMFNVLGDANGRHHAPGRPFLDFVTGIGFLVGLTALLRHWRDWRNLFLLAALGIGILPGFFAVAAPHAMRTFGACAFAYIIAALGWVELLRLGSEYLTQRRRDAETQRKTSYEGRVAQTSSRFLVLGSWFSVLVACALNAWLYFGSMATNPEVYYEFYPVESQVGQYLRQVAEGDGPVTLSTLYMPEPLATDPVIAFLAAGLPLPQTFGRGGLAQAPPGARILVPAATDTYTPDLAVLAPVLGAAPQPVERGPNFPGTSEPTFVVYQVGP